jgi:hypothetical protein
MNERLCVCGRPHALTFYPRSYLKTHERARTHTHTFYGFDVFSRYSLVAPHFGVTYTLPHCKAFDIFIALALS